MTYYKLAERLAKLMLFVSKAYHERDIVKTEIPPFKPHIKGKSVEKNLDEIEIPGFDAIVVLCAVAIVILKANRKR